MVNSNDKIDLSVVIPLYDEAENLSPLFARLREELGKLDLNWEVIFVDDGSDDDSLARMREIKAASDRVKIIQFRRNFGKSAALSAGFKLVRGDKVVIMDADLQDDPNEIPSLLEKIDQGFDLVSGWRIKRHDRLVKRYTSRIFNRATSIMTGVKMHDFNCGLKAFRREVTDAVPLYGELHRYIPVLAYWKGFKVTEKQVRHHPRAFGRSKFGLYRFFAGFTDLITVMFLTKYVKKPLHLFGGIGLFFFVAGLLINAYLVGVDLLLGNVIRVRPLLFLGVLLMLIGFQFISTGLLGEMMAMTHQEDEAEYLIRRIWD